MWAPVVLLLVVSSAATAFASGETAAAAAVDQRQHQRWVTDVLHDALDEYTPDGGPVCRRDGHAYREGLKDLQLWATRMYDASAKFPTGILSGKSYDFGDYDECLETDTIGLNFKPQYCIINIRFSPSPRVYPNYYDTSPPKLSQSIPAWEAVKPYQNQLKVQRNEINTAICVPSTCTHSDLQSTLSSKIVSTFHELEINTTVNVDSLYCTTQDTDTPKTLGFIMFWCFLLVIVLFIIVGSMYDFYSEEDTTSKCKLIFVAFSVQSNLKKLFYNNTNNTEFSCFYFLKVLACVVIFFGHRLMYSISYPVYNIVEVEKTFDIPFFGIFHNGPIVVDIFFTISGFLTFVSMYDALEKIKRFNMPLILFFRWCRLIPVYGLMIAFNAFVFLHVSDGPIWKFIAVRESENCLKNWWTNLLFVNNYVDTENPCVMQSWYLACDLHMCALGIVLVYLVWKFPKCETFALLTAVLASCFASAYVVYQHNYYPTFIGFIKALNYPPSQEIFRQLYITTHTRLTPYFVGMYAAHVYRGIRAGEPDYRFSRPTLRLWALFCGYMAWMVTIVYFYEYDYNLWVSVVYAFAFRLVFAAIVSAFIIVCAVNSCFKGTWTLVLAPISRLAYSAYIGGLTMQLYHAASARTPLFFNPMRLLWITIGDLTNGFVVAFFLYMLIESPFENLLKLVIGKMKEGIHKAEERTPNDVEMSPTYTKREE